jgi:hypothetical protein
MHFKLILFQQQQQKVAERIYVTRAVQKCNTNFPRKEAAERISVTRAVQKCNKTT